MKQIKVAAAIIHRDGKILATQRGSGAQKDGWEFPGGKVEPGETPEAAVVREIAEELDAAVAVESLLMTVEHDYPAFHLSMDCFLCGIAGGAITLKEHENAKWLNRDELLLVDWLPADRIVAETLAAQWI